MLILTRRVGETIIIGDKNIKVSISEIRGNQVRLCIHAPKDIAIDREEIHHKKMKQKLTAHQAQVLTQITNHSVKPI
jgi:carbon storage regulator